MWDTHLNAPAVKEFLLAQFLLRKLSITEARRHTMQHVIRIWGFLCKRVENFYKTWLVSWFCSTKPGSPPALALTAVVGPIEIQPAMERRNCRLFWRNEGAVEQKSGKKKKRQLPNPLRPTNGNEVLRRELGDQMEGQRGRE